MKNYPLHIFVIITLFLSGPAMLTAAESVRVGIRDGVPQILVDGRPVRARMFFGNPGSRPIPLSTEWKTYSYEFIPTENEPKTATVHFRFDRMPLTARLDDILLEELNADGKAVRNVFGPCRFDGGMDDFKKDWTFWPTGETNTVGEISVETTDGNPSGPALVVRQKKPQAGSWPDFHIYHHPNLALDKSKRYRFSFRAVCDIDVGLRIAFYRPGTSFSYLGGADDDFFRNQVDMAVKSGARFVSFSIGMPWPKDGEQYDWTTVDAACRRVLDANPEALLIPRVPMDAPNWWLDKNPGLEIKWDREPSKDQGRRVASVTSSDYRREAAKHLDMLVRHLEETFGASMAGYHPCGQNTGEWFYQDTWGPALNGYAETDRKAWRTWLAGYYKTDEALRKAWKDDKATITGAEVPSPELRRSIAGGVFRDIAVDPRFQSVLDFVRHQQEAMIDTVLDFSKTVRQASTGKRMVVIFYGYVFEFAPVQTGPATSGHYALRKVLESPDIDILCSPISYFDRKRGGSGAAMTAAESVALADKMWLYEDDTRTHLTPKPFTFPGGPDGADTVDETRSHLLRNTGQCAIRNFGTWWMDLGAAGWFDDPRLWDEMKKLEKLDRLFLDRPTPYRPEVAAILDESSMLTVSPAGTVVTRPGVYMVREPLARMGAPYGQYLLDDYLAGKIEAKLNVFVAAWQLSSEQRKTLREKAQSGNAVNLWCYAPGFLDTEKGGSVETMRELTGLTLKRLDDGDTPVHAWAEPTEVGKKFGLETGFGIKSPVKPLFAVADAKPEEILATFSDGSAAVVMRGNTMFVGAPGLTSSLLRIAARKAKVHLYTETDCNVYANGSALVLHGAADGPVKLRFRKNCTVTDLLDGSAMGKGSTLELPLKLGETRIFRLTEN